MDHIPSNKSASFVDTSADDYMPRAHFAPHTTHDEGGFHIVHPAGSLKIGTLHDRDNDRPVPIIRVDHVGGPTSLLFVPNAQEMRLFATAMTQMADEMEAEAADLLAGALKRKPGA
jgi:hypothetical protein